MRVSQDSQRAFRLDESRNKNVKGTPRQRLGKPKDVSGPRSSPKVSAFGTASSAGRIGTRLAGLSVPEALVGWCGDSASVKPSYRPNNRTVVIMR
jgi:hypothetical protein